MACCVPLLLLLSLVSLTSVPLLLLDLEVYGSQEEEEDMYIPSPSTQVLVVSTSDSKDNYLWASKHANYYRGCSSSSNSYPRSISKSRSTGYILIQTSGGLNQQRTGIIDAVVAARILNATLVVPDLDHNSFWRDTSNFSDIFDVNWFISSLSSDVPIVKKLPLKPELSEERIYSTRVPRKCEAEYFKEKVLPLLQRKKAVRLTKFDYRLSNRLEVELQKLRCRVNYNALRFTTPIRMMGEILVERLRQRSGRYIALHLRFEPDMLAFSGCYFGGGEVELQDLGRVRKRWKSLHQKNPERERRNGKCPLTPEEVGLMLKALGFGSDSYLYVASGEVYGGEKTLAPLKAMFPKFYTKESLATKAELKPFLHYSSRMAAIDYIVCDESDVFVTNNNGNMARILSGRRRYFGHKRTIRPYTKKLGPLFLAKPNMTWNEFASKLHKVQKGFMGEPNELKIGTGQFFENPDVCICESPKALEDEIIQIRSFKEEKDEMSIVPQPNDDDDDDRDDNEESDQEDESYNYNGHHLPQGEDVPWFSD